MKSFCLLVTLCLVALFVGSNCQETDTGTEVESSTPGVVVDYEPEYKPKRPHISDRFDRWMKVLNEFFTEGNWLNGGPDNLMEFITKTLAKLLDILIPKQITGGENESRDKITFGRPYRRPSGSSPTLLPSSSSFSSRDTSGLTISDLIRMLPQDSLNMPVDRIMGGSRRS